MDPSVLLKMQPRVQFPDPLEVYGKMMSLRQMMDLGKLRQVQLKQNELENLQKQRDLDEYEMYRRGVSQLPANATLDQTIQALGPNYGAAHFKLTHEAQTAANQAEEAKYKRTQEANKLRLGSLQDLANAESAIQQLPKDQQQDAWDTMWGGLPVDRPPSGAQTNADYINAFGIKAFEERDRAREEEARKVAEWQINLPKWRADALKAQNEAAGTQPISPYQQAQLNQQQAVLQQRKIPNNLDELDIALADPNLPKELRTQYEAARPAMVERDKMRHPGPAAMPVYGSPLTELHGEDFLNTLKPQDAGLIRALAEGRETLSGRSSKDAIALKKAVLQYDPTFNEQRAQLRKKYASDKNIIANNTAIVHLGQLAEASEALGNGTFRPGNELYQRLQGAFGSGRVTKFELLKDAVAGEMASALKGSATYVEIANMKHSINIANSPEQMRDAVTESLKVLSAKLNSYDENYQQQAGGDAVWSPFLPSARATMQRFGVKGGGVAAPDTSNAAPPIGTVKKGYYFKGGNPAVKENWIKIGK